MKLSIYENFPNDAKEIRKAVFIEEQGFQNEFDEIDNTATHLVLFDYHLPIATCRVFWNNEINSYTLGRLAVIKKYRGKHIGQMIVKEAENYVKEKGGNTIILHAQCQASDFYRKLGFIEFGTIEEEEGCPHIWMKKFIKNKN